jgi:hypothetical protein
MAAELTPFSITSIVASEKVAGGMARKALGAILNSKVGFVNVSFDDNGVLTVSGAHGKNLKPAADDAEEAVEGTE